MDKYEVFSLIALSVSMFAMIFCAYGLVYSLKNVDYLEKLLLGARRQMCKRKEHKEER